MCLIRLSNVVWWVLMMSVLLDVVVFMVFFICVLFVEFMVEVGLFMIYIVGFCIMVLVIVIVCCWFFESKFLCFLMFCFMLLVLLLISFVKLYWVSIF